MSRISYDSYRTPYYLSIIPVIQSSTEIEVDISNHHLNIKKNNENRRAEMM